MNDPLLEQLAHLLASLHQHIADVDAFHHRDRNNPEVQQTLNDLHLQVTPFRHEIQRRLVDIILRGNP